MSRAARAARRHGGPTTQALPARLVLGLAIVFAGMQFFRPGRTNPPVDPTQSIQAAGEVPPAVDAILRRSCYDCHSNQTRWPWYSAVAPMAWGVADHVSEGRAELNFSGWGAYPAKRRAGLLEKICGEVREGRMPLKQYLWLHRDAALSETDWTSVCDWSAAAAGRLAAGR